MFCMLKGIIYVFHLFKIKKTQRNIVGYKLAYLRLNVRAKRLGRKKMIFNGDNFANICVAVLSIISLNTMKKLYC